MKLPLKNKIALVAGATRGAGRGIATALGEAGATVYCTGRSSRRGKVNKKRPETIEETAEMVTARGGRGIPARVDHSDSKQVRRLVSRIRREQGRLDILVNDIWGGDELTEWGSRLWQTSLDKGLTMLERAIHTHLITSHAAIPLMLGHNGTIIEITDGEGMYYRGNIYYDLVKTSVIRLAFAMAQELKKHKISAIAVTPGFLRSEAMLDNFGVTEENWRDGAKKQPFFIASETPLYVGRAVAALVADPKNSNKSGRVYSSAELAQEYGFTDADGTQPSFRRHIEQNAPHFLFPRLDDKFWSYFDGPYEVMDAQFEKMRSKSRPARRAR
jgi:NAD(P)-dependent dehydrogenase (short-subunit alcohol dehydrogenase family)